MIHIFIWTLSALYGCIGSVYTRHWMTENSDVKLAHLPPCGSLHCYMAGRHAYVWSVLATNQSNVP